METQTRRGSFRRVVVTRPKEQSQSWIDRIVAAGCEPVEVSALEILPIRDHCKLQKIRDTILTLEDYSIAIFVSQNAVRFGFDWIEDFWTRIPKGLRYLAIGSKTHEMLLQRLQRHGQELKSYSPGQMTSEELLGLPLLRHVQTDKILIFRGLGGRTTLYDTLKERGAVVEHCELYERNLPSDATSELDAKKILPLSDILTFFSGETLENFAMLLERNQVNQWQSFFILVPSERVYRMARKLGFSSIICAKNASEDAMWHALQPYLSES